MPKIAIIEDDQHIGDVLERTLGREGYETLRAYSGTEALYLLAQNNPDLILLDLMLPGLPGEEVLHQMKGIPVIVVSAKVGVDDKVNLLLSGASDYITKPFLLIVSNILSNVLKYSDQDLFVQLYSDGTITFTNSAKNLTPVMVERLFDRFYTVETGQNSTGLGLSIAKALVERIGGQIQAVYEDQKLTIVLKFRSA